MLSRRCSGMYSARQGWPLGPISRWPLTWRRAISIAMASYQLGSKRCTPPEMIAQIVAWVERYPIVSIEDGLAEDDWQHWPLLQAALAGRAAVMGDDLLCTNPLRIRRAIELARLRRAAAEGQSNRHAQRGAAGLATGPLGRLESHRLGAQRRHRGQLVRRPGRSVGRLTTPRRAR